MLKQFDFLKSSNSQTDFLASKTRWRSTWNLEQTVHFLHLNPRLIEMCRVFLRDQDNHAAWRIKDVISTHRSTSDLNVFICDMYIEVTLVIAQSLMIVRFTRLPSSFAFHICQALHVSLVGDHGSLSVSLPFV